MTLIRLFVVSVNIINKLVTFNIICVDDPVLVDYTCVHAIKFGQSVVIDHYKQVRKVSCGQHNTKVALSVGCYIKMCWIEHNVASILRSRVVSSEGTAGSSKDNHQD